MHKKVLRNISKQFSHHYAALLALAGDGGAILAMIMVNQKSSLLLAADGNQPAHSHTIIARCLTLHYTILHCILHCTSLQYYTVLYYTVLNYATLHFTKLSYTTNYNTLHYTTL